MAASKKCVLERKEKCAISVAIAPASSLRPTLSIGVTQSAYHLIEYGFHAVQLDLFVASLQHVDCIGDVALTKMAMAEAKARNAMLYAWLARTARSKPI